DNIGDLAGVQGRVLGQLADLLRNYHKTLAMLPRAGGFNCGIERKDMGAMGYLGDYFSELLYLFAVLNDGLDHGLQLRNSGLTLKHQSVGGIRFGAGVADVLGHHVDGLDRFSLRKSHLFKLVELSPRPAGDLGNAPRYLLKLGQQPSQDIKHYPGDENRGEKNEPVS